MKKILICGMLLLSLNFVSCDLLKSRAETNIGERKYRVELYSENESLLIDNYSFIDENTIAYYIDGTEYLYSGSYKIEEVKYKSEKTIVGYEEIN